MSEIIDHSHALSPSYEALLVKSKHSDVILVASEVEFPVHRIILANQSIFFEKLFYENQFKEADEDKMMIEASARPFSAILTFMYCGMFYTKGLSIEELFQCVELACRFELNTLRESILNHLVSLVKMSNLDLMIKTARLMDAEVLRKQCCRVMNIHGPDFFEEHIFENFTKQEVLEILAYPELKVSAMKRFEAIHSWLKLHPECDKNDPELKSLVNLSKLSNAQLIRRVKRSQMFSDAEIMAVLTARTGDIPEECNENSTTGETNYLSAKNGALVLVGKELNNFQTILGEKINGDFEIVIDLGVLIQFNYISMNLGKKMPHHYRICYLNSRVKSYEIDSSPNEHNWIEIVAYFSAKGHQNIYLKSFSTKYLRITGAAECNNLIISDVFNFPDIKRNYICPKMNIFTPETAYISTGSSANLLRWDQRDLGIATPFTESKFVLLNGNLNPAIEIRLNQTHYLRKLSFRFWDYDGRKQYVALEGINSYDVPIFIRNFEAADGCYMIKIPARGYNGFRFKYLIGDWKCEKSIRITHFEASG